MTGIKQHDLQDDTCGDQSYDARVSGISGPEALIDTIDRLAAHAAGQA